MSYVINGKKFDYSTSEELYSGGDGQSLFREHGRLTVYRSPKGTVWATHQWWRSQVTEVVETAAGEADVRRLCASLHNVRALESFAAIEQG